MYYLCSVRYACNVAEMKEKFKDTIWIIKSRKSKNRQYKDHKKTDKQRPTKTIKDWATRTSD